MNLRPTELNLTAENRLRIAWNDGSQREYSARELRDHCPCASCREQRRSTSETGDLLPVLSSAELQPLRIMDMQPVGNYAYTIKFSDGHDTGIFQLSLLGQLGQPVSQ